MVENKSIAENPPLVYVEAVEGNTTYVPPKPTEQWTCPQCTLLNPARKLYCIACFHRHPDLTPADLGARAPSSAPPSIPSAPSEEVDTNDDHPDDEGEYEYEYEDDNRENVAPNNNARDIVERDVVTSGSGSSSSTTNEGCASSENVIQLFAEEDPFHKKVRRRVRRKKRMVAGGAAGVAATVIVGAPALMVAAGAVGGAAAARMVSKHREKLKDERIAMERYVIETKAQAAVS